MKTNTAIERNNTLLYRKIGDELALISLNDEKLYLLNDVAAFIWDMTEKEKNIDEIVKAMAAEYDLNKDIIVRDLDDFLKDIQASCQELFNISNPAK